jgi:hypothetical protein
MRALGMIAQAPTALNFGLARVPRMFPEDQAAIFRRLAELKIEHRDLDVLIASVPIGPGSDELHLKRMKKRKLRLKDMIAYLENKLIPDLDA